MAALLLIPAVWGLIVEIIHAFIQRVHERQRLEECEAAAGPGLWSIPHWILLIFASHALIL